MADTTHAVPTRANTPRDCYLNTGHSGHDLLAPGTRCQFCGFIAPTDAELSARINAETIVAMQGNARELEAALRDLLKQMDDEESNREEGIFAVPGCRVCTHGVTPDRWHTGPCARHRAEELLRKRGAL